MTDRGRSLPTTSWGWILLLGAIGAISGAKDAPACSAGTTAGAPGACCDPAALPPSCGCCGVSTKRAAPRPPGETRAALPSEASPGIGPARSPTASPPRCDCRADSPASAPDRAPVRTVPPRPAPDSGTIAGLPAPRRPSPAPAIRDAADNDDDRSSKVPRYLRISRLLL